MENDADADVYVEGVEERDELSLVVFFFGGEVEMRDGGAGGAGTGA